MSEDQSTNAMEVAKKNVGHRFPPGHPRFGGRKKKTAAAARAMAESMGADPLKFMLSIINSDVVEQTVMVEGKRKRIEVAIPLDVRLDAAKTVIQYLHPRLLAQQITGADDGPIETVGFDLTKLIMENPDMVDAAQRLAIGLAKPDVEPEPGQRLLPPSEFFPQK